MDTPWRDLNTDDDDDDDDLIYHIMCDGNLDYSYHNISIQMMMETPLNENYYDEDDHACICND